MKTNVEGPFGKSEGRWRVILQGIIILSGSLLMGGLLALKQMSYVNWQSEVEKFKWLVLVKGDLVTVDEVGRYLTELDGVEEAKLVDRNQILAQLSSEQLWPEDATALGADSIPQTWQITWGENPKSLADQKALLADIQKQDGVVDVAFDPHGLDRIRNWRKLWLTSRLILASLVFIFVLGIGLVMGKIIFFRRFKPPKWGQAGIELAGAFIPWCLGYLAGALIYGFLPPLFLLGGLALSAGLLLWSHSEI